MHTDSSCRLPPQPTFIGYSGAQVEFWYISLRWTCTAHFVYVSTVSAGISIHICIWFEIIRILHKCGLFIVVLRTSTYLHIDSLIVGWLGDRLDQWENELTRTRNSIGDNFEPESGMILAWYFGSNSDRSPDSYMLMWITLLHTEIRIRVQEFGVGFWSFNSSEILRFCILFKYKWKLSH